MPIFVLLSEQVEEQAQLTGVQDYVAEHDLGWEVIPCPNKVPIFWQARLADARSPGVVIGRTLHEEVIATAQQRGLYWVAWCRDGELSEGDAAIGFDPDSIGRQAVDYLSALGCRTFAVQGPMDRPEHHTRRNRYRAFEATLHDRGSPCHVVLAQRHSMEHDLVELQSFCQTMPKPIGFFLPNDRMAVWLTATLRLAGVMVPQQALVLGCGDSPEGRGNEPAISSIRLPYHALGHAGALQAHRLLSGNRPAPLAIAALGVIERASTVALADADDPVLDRALKRVARGDRPIPSVDELARLCQVDRDTLAKRFRRRFGQPPKVWLSQRALQRAATLLVDGDAPLQSIARACGLRHDTHLIARFRQRFGITPGAYRRRHRRSPPPPHR